MKHGVGSKKKSEKEKHLPCNQNHLGMKQKSWNPIDAELF